MHIPPLYELSVSNSGKAGMHAKKFGPALQKPSQQPTHFSCLLSKNQSQQPTHFSCHLMERAQRGLRVLLAIFARESSANQRARCEVAFRLNDLMSRGRCAVPQGG
jgi:hypothetical protein